MYKNFTQTFSSDTVQGTSKKTKQQDNKENTYMEQPVESKDSKSKKVSTTKIIDKADKKVTSSVEELAEEENDQEVESCDGEESMIISDMFRVTSKNSNLNNCLQLISFIQLPKFIFSPSKKVQRSTKGGDKSPLLLKFIGTINKAEKINPYHDLLKASRDGLDDLNIEVLDEDETSLLKVTIVDPRIHAIDFGDFAIERKDFREIKVEVDFEYIRINDEEL